MSWFEQNVYTILFGATFLFMLGTSAWLFIRDIHVVCP